MSYELFIAKRYLVSKQKSGWITVITLISITGVTVGVAALIVVLSVFNGFNSLVTSILVGFDPHLRVESTEGQAMRMERSVEGVLRADQRVKAFAPFVLGKSLVLAGGYSQAAFIKGVDEGKVGTVSGVEKSIVLGNFRLDEGKEEGIVLGLTLADRLHVVVGSTVTVISPVGIEAVATQLAQPLMKRFKLVGIYESKNRDYDAKYAYVSLGAAQQLFDIRGKIDGLELRLNSIDDAENVKADLQRKFGDSYTVSTWYDLHRDLYSVMQVERWVAYIILSLIILVAAFNILGSLTMSVLEKTRDIGVLRSMGAAASGVRRVFLIEGLFVGIIGSALGSLLGFGTYLLQKYFQVFPLDPNVYIIPALPVELHVADFITVAAAALIICTLSALYPARRASRL
ncbi:MAG TPA: ABC transporter permease, partial [Rhodothermia bacterium]|nr:ABC transporter permease [Rhodothermia bacterium]